MLEMASQLALILRNTSNAGLDSSETHNYLPGKMQGILALPAAVMYHNDPLTPVLPAHTDTERAKKIP